jgi:glycosyltransferase involved in cell wall biosynthesis
VLDLTLMALREAGCSWTLLKPVRDLDTPEDARHVAADPRCPGDPTAPPPPDAGMSDQPLVSIIVPVLNEQGEIAAVLDQLASLSGSFEVIVVDGGSTDLTGELARRHPLSPRVISATRGRASQCNAGAAAARGSLLLFLHADTRLPDGAYQSLIRAIADPRVVGGNFALRFDGGDRFSRLLGAWYAAQRRAGMLLRRLGDLAAA